MGRDRTTAFTLKSAPVPSKVPVSGLRSQVSPSSSPPSAPIPVSGLKSQVSETAAVSSAIVAYFVDAAALLGVPKSVAAIYGTCFASSEPLSFSEIQERLDLSAGSISQGLKLLREMGALKIVDHPHSLAPSVPQTYRTGGNGDNGGTESGHRIPTSVASVSSCSNQAGLIPKAYRGGSAARYTPDLELRRLAQHFLEKRVHPQLASGSDRLGAILETVAAGPVRARLEHLQNWHVKADALLPFAAAFLEVPLPRSPS